MKQQFTLLLLALMMTQCVMGAEDYSGSDAGSPSSSPLKVPRSPQVRGLMSRGLDLEHIPVTPSTPEHIRREQHCRHQITASAQAHEALVNIVRYGIGGDMVPSVSPYGSPLKEVKNVIHTAAEASPVHGRMVPQTPEGNRLRMNPRRLVCDDKIEAGKSKQKRKEPLFTGVRAALIQEMFKRKNRFVSAEIVD